MPSTTTQLAVIAALAGVLGLLYVGAIANEIVVGLAVALGCAVVAVLLYAGGTNRETVAAVTMGATVVYGVFTLQFPTAVVAACVVYLTLWVTDPDGPFDASPPSVIPERVLDDASKEYAEEAAE
ncbi:hypothetical protein [Halobacterium sp. KA-6]|uniref:hypothetical protein n=1 Tax=Halobacterium sp. KA-6 TaxID=2896368 RepID=UPI001E341D36|nr:hypothetical protein [Halobacterium sp. KA-6]MCD2204470.1 hypothetical protein [Halobacterium sp. KA-6]